MHGENYKDILAFFAVARERSFTRAAAQLGVSQSALSHTIRGLEERLGLRLLTRTTRSVSPTEAGERLLQRLAPRFEAISEELNAFADLRNKPMGAVRLTATDFAANTVLWPRLSRLTKKYPDIKIEIAVEPGFTDIVAGRFDAGVRFGDQTAKDMTAVRISPDIRMGIFAAATYLAKRPPPSDPADLTDHDCINLRFSNEKRAYAWELKKGRRSVSVRVEGAWTFNAVQPALEAALAGFGLAYMPEDLAKQHAMSGRLKPVLRDWWPTVPGLHIVFPDRYQSPALSLVVAALRYPRQAG